MTTRTFLPKRYVIWNPSKLYQGTSLNRDTLLGLVDAELRTEASLSSVVSTRDIKGLIDAVYNETDIMLCYASEKDYEAKTKFLLGVE